MFGNRQAKGTMQVNINLYRVPQPHLQAPVGWVVGSSAWWPVHGKRRKASEGHVSEGCGAIHTSKLNHSCIKGNQKWAITLLTGETNRGSLLGVLNPRVDTPCGLLRRSSPDMRLSVRRAPRPVPGVLPAARKAQHPLLKAQASSDR
jgi:hypothetical protein